MICDCRCLYFSVFALLVPLVPQGSAHTDNSDVKALQDLYRSFNTPPQLKGWKSNGGDPCQESWTGVSCAGSSIIEIKLDNLNISGNLGYQLNNLHHLKQLDVSNNNIYGEIPYGLPLNLTHLNLACNNLSQYIPYSISSMKNIRHMNLSHNFLSGPVGNVFTGLASLKEMDLSYNEFIGDLPSSFGTLRGLSRLFLQHNEFTGSVIFLASLQLTDLNIQDNHFSGIIPKQFQSIQNLWFGGNMFDKGNNSPPWDFPMENLPDPNITAPSSESSAITNDPSPESSRHKKKKIRFIVIMVVGSTFLVASLAIFIKIRFHNRARKLRRRPESSEGSRHSLPISMARDCSSTALDESPEVSAISSPTAGPRHVPPVRTKVVRVNRRRSFAKKSRIPIGAKLYTVAELQLATNSFNRTNFLGEGSIGSVFRAEFPDGQIFAVKCISMVVLSLLEEQQFLEVIWNASRLRHPNIIHLHGYCTEQGQHMLVYEYVRNLSLDDALHSDTYVPLSWGLRLRIALGIARALNYLHSICMPPLAHRNLKAANVLLDEDLTPRICDCCLAVLKPLTINSARAEASETDTGCIVPEDNQSVTSDQKDDIYAFGVLLLELLTGRKPFEGNESREENSLVQWASSRLHDNESLDQMVEAAIRKSIPPKALSRFADVVSLCTQAEKGFRPPMSEIMESLAHLLEDYRKSRTAAETEFDPYERSFRSTHSRFIGSPTMSYMSI
ncbi:protein STRUBBELIG-RECEPTOR FAMILY 2 [Cynara cardunculus var. scolymus]|uniref:protein STRUBBELIG-RECEPTOR FAMILY 2 n=1 Tax=Cynara cardunculus var. scolymus TaxID=59895 RepID=UPI000D6315B2|nr:protein STRUBBELIG-RECEPTOR FAMILY 2 [Cynara cardunculus var. scolymus]